MHIAARPDQRQSQCRREQHQPGDKEHRSGAEQPERVALEESHHGAMPAGAVTSRLAPGRRILKMLPWPNSLCTLIAQP